MLRNSSIRRLTLEQTAKFVIISSYPTFTARCFKGTYRKVVKGSTEAMQPHLDDQVFVNQETTPCDNAGRPMPKNRGKLAEAKAAAPDVRTRDGMPLYSVGVRKVLAKRTAEARKADREKKKMQRVRDKAEAKAERKAQRERRKKLGPRSDEFVTDEDKADDEPDPPPDSDIDGDEDEVDDDYVEEDLDEEEEIMMANDEETVALMEDEEYRLSNSMARGDDYNWEDDAEFIESATHEQRKTRAKAKGREDVDEATLDESDFTYVKNFLLKLSDGTFQAPVFDFVICDEAHYIRHRHTTYARMVQQIPKKSVLLMTATPILNRIEDIRGLAWQIKCASRIKIGMQMPDWANWHYLATHSFQPFASEGILIPPNPRQQVMGRVRRQKAATIIGDEVEFDPSKQDQQGIYNAIFHESYSDEKREALIEAAQRGIRFWCLHRWAMSMVKTSGGDEATSDAILKQFFTDFVLRRTMTTGIIDPNDPSNVIFPREHMPAFRCRTEDVRYNEFMEGVVSDLTMEFLKILPTLPPDDDERIVEGDAANVPDKRESPEQSKGSINMMFHRILQLLAMDYKSMVLCLRRDGLSTRSSESVANMVTSIRNEAMEAFLRSGRGRHDRLLKAEKAPEASLSTGQMDRLAHFDPDGGLSYYVAATLRDKRIPPPASDRMSMVTYCITDSPILFRAVELIRENKKVGKRTLVLVFSQVMQQ